MRLCVFVFVLCFVFVLHFFRDLHLLYLLRVPRFRVEFVTYKWPEWLRRQSEKQRIIWGYKILFLDVLFPLNVDKVIYVDADQVMNLISARLCCVFSNTEQSTDKEENPPFETGLRRT